MPRMHTMLHAGPGLYASMAATTHPTHTAIYAAIPIADFYNYQVTDSTIICQCKLVATNVN